MNEAVPQLAASTLLLNPNRHTAYIPTKLIRVRTETR
jgi:hypothetical protein